MDAAALKGWPAGLALAGSAALHAAVLLGAGALLASPARRAIEPRVEAVVHVTLAPPSPPAVAAAPIVAPRVHVAPPIATPAAAPPLPILTTVAIAPAEPAPAPVTVAPARPAPAGVAGAPAPAVRVAALAPRGLETPTYLHAPEPEYPEDAREDEQEGLVVLHVLVSRAGRPARIRVATSSGFRRLDAAAVAGVARWTFAPARRADEDIEAWMEIPVRFRLR